MAHYINNKQFTEELTNYSKKFKEKLAEGYEEEEVFKLVKMPESIGEKLVEMANKITSRSGFSYLSFTDEMASDAILEAFRKCWKFDYENYDNGFSYITTIMFTSCIHRITKEKKQTEIRDNIILNMNNMFDEEEISALQIETLQRNIDEKAKFSEIDPEFRYKSPIRVKEVA